MPDKKPTTEDILRKYGAKIEGELKGYTPGKFSGSYETFRKAMTPRFSRYEKWCKALGNLFHMNLAEKDRIEIEKNIHTAHLDLTASEVVVFAFTALMLGFFGGMLLLVGIWRIAGGNFPVFFTFLIMLFSGFLFYYTYNIPRRLALEWRLKASSQMVPAILYIVIYMKQNSNFERAVQFAAEHLEEPLSLDFRKVFYDVEIGRYSSIKESVDNYLETWRESGIEFIEAFHLIESSLYEPSEDRRIQTLEKALQVILDGVYDKMLKYSHDVKSPLTNIYMLGIILPTLSLAILPLASTMLGGLIQWYHILMLFNVIIPFMVLYLTMNVMMGRPGGYGEQSLLEKNPLYYKYNTNKYFVKSGLMMLPFFILGILPLICRYTNLPIALGLQRDYTWNQIGMGFFGQGGVLGIVEINGKLSGPFGTLSLFLSLLVPISIAFMFIIAYNMKTKELIKERERYKQVEGEFASSLFQLGNRLGDGIPAEIAFAKVAESTKGTHAEGFFRIVNENIHNLGMSLEEALFNSRRGAIIFYPSHLIATSMRILIESVKKGLKISARALMSISEYVKNIRKIDDRLRDLLADVISDMSSNMTFLAPLLAGIVIGLAGMITTILSTLSELIKVSITETGELALTGGLTNVLGIFKVGEMIPTYWLQVVVGIYLIEIVFILTSTLVTVKAGKDSLETTYETGNNLKKAIVFYSVVAFASILALTLLAGIVLKNLA